MEQPEKSISAHPNDDRTAPRVFEIWTPRGTKLLVQSLADESSKGGNAREHFPRAPSSEHARYSQDRSAVAQSTGAIVNQYGLQPSALDNSAGITLSDQTGQTFKLTTRTELSEVKIPTIPSKAAKFNDWLMDVANAVNKELHSNNLTKGHTIG